MNMTCIGDLLPGDILLARSPGAVGWLIRLGERARYTGWPATLKWLAAAAVRVAQPDTPGEPWYVNHAAVCVAPGQLIEALGDGLCLSPLSKYSSRQTVTVPLAQLIPDVTDVTRERVASFAGEQLRRHYRYGWLSICSIILQLVTPLRLDLSWDGALTCSAFAAQCLEHAGLTLPCLSSLTTMPADLAALARTPPPPPAATRRNAA